MKHAARRDSSDQITRRMLGGEYLQRFRETGDLNDVTRALAVASDSLRLATAGQRPGAGRHRFLRHRAASFRSRPWRARIAPSKPNRSTTTRAHRSRPFSWSWAATSAPVTFSLVRSKPIQTRPGCRSARATTSLTGDLAGARVQMAQAAAIVDRIIVIPAYTRSWYHARDGQLAFEAGDTASAAAEFDEALRIFPDNAMALLFEAKLYRAHRDWPRALASATRSAELYPLPQALGYEADAQRALGDSSRRAPHRRADPRRTASFQRSRHERSAARDVLCRAPRAFGRRARRGAVRPGQTRRRDLRRRYDGLGAGRDRSMEGGAYVRDPRDAIRYGGPRASVSCRRHRLAYRARRRSPPAPACGARERSAVPSVSMPTMPARILAAIGE